MSCQTLTIGGDVVHVNFGPAMKEVKRESRGVKWCFSCRTRTEFFFTVHAPIVPDYYGPTCDIRCSNCNKSDADLFPGHEREWE